MIRSLAICLALTATLISWDGAAQAQQPDFSGLTKGAQITVQGRVYIVLPEVRAVCDLRSGESGGQVLRRQNKAGRTVVEEKRPFLLFLESGAVQPTGIVATDGATFPVALNPESGGLAVLTGTIIVKLKPSADPTVVAADLQLSLANRFDHLRLFFYRPATGRDLLATLAALRIDARVESADPDVLEFLSGPN